jgi:hypothetical protein
MDHPVIKLGKIKNTKRNAEPCMVRVTGAVSHVLPYLLNEGYRYRRWTWATQAASPCPKRRSGRNLWCRTLHWGLQIGAPLGSCYSRIGAAAPSAGQPAGSAAPARVPPPWSTLACNSMAWKDLEMDSLVENRKRSFITCFSQAREMSVSGPCLIVVGLLKNII